MILLRRMLCWILDLSLLAVLFFGLTLVNKLIPFHNGKFYYFLDVIELVTIYIILFLIVPFFLKKKTIFQLVFKLEIKGSSEKLKYLEYFKFIFFPITLPLLLIVINLLLAPLNSSFVSTIIETLINGSLLLITLFAITALIDKNHVAIHEKLFKIYCINSFEEEKIELGKFDITEEYTSIIKPSINDESVNEIDKILRSNNETV